MWPLVFAVSRQAKKRHGRETDGLDMSTPYPLNHAQEGCTVSEAATHAQIVRRRW